MPLDDTCTSDFHLYKLCLYSFLLLFATFFTLFTFDQFFRLIITKKSDPKWSSSCLKYSSSTVEMVTNEPKWLQVKSSVIFDQLIYYMVIIFTVPHHTIQGRCILRASVEAPTTCPSLRPLHIHHCTRRASVLAPVARPSPHPSRVHPCARCVPISCPLCIRHCTRHASVVVPAAHPSLYPPRVRRCARCVAVLYPSHGCLVPIVRPLLCPSRARCRVRHVPVVASCVRGASVVASCVRCASIIAPCVRCASVVAPSLDLSCVRHWVCRASIVESVVRPSLRLSWSCCCVHRASIVVLAVCPSVKVLRP